MRTLGIASALFIAGCSSQPKAEPPAPQPPPPLPQRAERVAVETLESGARRIRIPDAEAYWKDGGFIELAPTMRLAIANRGRPHVAVQFRLRDDKSVGAQQVDGRDTIVLPPGAEADRVSMIRYRGGLTVADVRGSRIDDRGREWFHVYRPASGKPNASLVGYEWLREDDAQRADAHALLLEHVSATPPPFSRQRPSRGYVRFFSRMNECESCHFSNKSAGTDPDDWLPLWPTDQVGWYVPLAVMLPTGALSTTSQWHDPNADDPLVEKRCATGTPQRERTRGGSWFTCKDGSVPFGVRDVTRGLLERDDYTEAVCRSRRYIFERMTSDAQRVFAAVMTACTTE